MRALIQWLRPRPLGQVASVGLGDRLGLATPGHIRALRAYPGPAPALAQQSVRELERTGRSMEEVLASATFGALAEGWRTGFGADADHLKTNADIEAAAAAGFTTFTADPIDLVPALPADAPGGSIRDAFERSPWDALEDRPADFRTRYPAQLKTEGGDIRLPTESLVAAAARFGPAVAHLAAMYRRLTAVTGEREVEFEIAVDEIAHPTTVVDHIYLATELRRLGVRWASFAPRFVGTFEKGADYIGEPQAFDADVGLHAAVARHFGPYKLSLHSGSDKFAIHEGFARETNGIAHLKTSGTSYLEALRTVASVNPDLLRKIWRVARSAYATARGSYHVSASVDRVPDPDGTPDDGLADLLDQRDARQILHVTYGAVLQHPETATDGADPGEELRVTLWTHRERYWSDLTDHIGRHLAPFSSRQEAAFDHFRG
jgi:hypothetical protein